MTFELHLSLLEFFSNCLSSCRKTHMQILIFDVTSTSEIRQAHVSGLNLHSFSISEDAAITAPLNKQSTGKQIN